MGRGPSAIPGLLADYLDMLNLEANDWIGIETLTERILGPAPQELWDRRPSSLYVEVLRPLVWCGLLLETGERLGERQVMKSPLWHAALTLPSNEVLGGRVRLKPSGGF